MPWLLPPSPLGENKGIKKRKRKYVILIDIFQSVGIVPDPTIQKMPLARIVSRAVPMTSLDDDDDLYSKPQVHDSHQSKENDDTFALALLKSHKEAQEIFDKARLEREQTAFMVAILQSHELTEQVFHQLRNEKEVEQLEMQKNMAALAQQAARLHENLEQIFANIGKEAQLSVSESEVVPSSPRPVGPLGALMEELKTKTTVIDPTEMSEDDISGEEESTSALIPVPGIVVATTLEESPVNANPSVTSDSEPQGTTRKISDSNNLMLDELKKVFNSTLNRKPSEGNEDDVSAEDINIAPSAIVQRRESHGLAVQNDSVAPEAH